MNVSSRMLRVGRTLGLVTTLALAACAPSVPKADLAAEEKAVRALSMHWLDLEGAKDAKSQAALFADNGVMYEAHHGPVVGPAAIQAAMAQEYAENPNIHLTWSTDAVLIAASGDVAVETGKYQVTGAGPSAAVSDSGTFVTVYRKVNGAWKVASDIGVTAAPESAPPREVPKPVAKPRPKKAAAKKK